MLSTISSYTCTAAGTDGPQVVKVSCCHARACMRPSLQRPRHMVRVLACVRVWAQLHTCGCMHARACVNVRLPGPSGPRATLWVCL